MDTQFEYRDMDWEGLLYLKKEWCVIELGTLLPNITLGRKWQQLNQCISWIDVWTEMYITIVMNGDSVKKLTAISLRTAVITISNTFLLYFYGWKICFKTAPFTFLFKMRILSIFYIDSRDLCYFRKFKAN